MSLSSIRFSKGLGKELIWEIIRAVQSGKTNNYEINEAYEYLEALKLGFTLHLDDLPYRTVRIIMELDKQQRLKQERESKTKRWLKLLSIQ